MSCFAFPAELCDEIEKLLCDFWWGYNENKPKMHWVSWKKLCLPKNKGGLGFRDLRNFNKALLAKQGWRILQNPNSLLARLLKAKYFPRTDFLEAGLGYRPSFIWRSILIGREALLKGCFRSVGNGASLKVWKDRWIPRPFVFRVISPIGANDPDLRVLDLVDWESGKWRSQLVESMFLPCDAEQILNLRLIDSSLPDEWTWFLSADGVFSVRSAYHALLQEEIVILQGGCASNQHQRVSVWDKIWKINSLPKVRNFLWRACKGVLPVKANLLKRHIIADSACEFCGLEETIEHVLFRCPEAKAVWKLLPEFKSFSNLRLLFVEIMELVLKSVDTDELALWAAVTWGLWRARNHRIFERTEVFAAGVVEEARLLSKEVKEAEGPAVPVMHVQAGVSSWSPPAEEVIKFNSDASVSDVRGCRISFVARNKRGEVLAVGSRRIQLTGDVQLAEAEAILWALEIAMEMDLTHIVVESDCLSIISKLQKGAAWRGQLGLVLHKIRLLCNGFHQCLWAHVRRSANRAANYLATSNLDLLAFDLCSVAIPSEFFDVIASDFGV